MNKNKKSEGIKELKNAVFIEISQCNLREGHCRRRYLFLRLVLENLLKSIFLCSYFWYCKCMYRYYYLLLWTFDGSIRLLFGFKVFLYYFTALNYLKCTVKARVRSFTCRLRCLGVMWSTPSPPLGGWRPKCTSWLAVYSFCQTECRISCWAFGWPGYRSPRPGTICSFSILFSFSYSIFRMLNLNYSTYSTVFVT